MGESQQDRAALLCQLAALQPHPESVPLNLLVRVPGTPLADAEPFDTLAFIRWIAVARIMMPGSYLRLSAGRQSLDESAQALAFLAGANSIFYGDRLLTTANAQMTKDQALLQKLGINRSHVAAVTDETTHEAALVDLLESASADFYDAAGPHPDTARSLPCGMKL